MIDVILLRIMKHRNDYGILSPLVHTDHLSKETALLLADFHKYFEQFPSHNVIDLTTFMTRFVGWHKGLEDAQVKVYAGIMANAMKPADDDHRAVILQELADLDMAIAMANTAASWEAGEVPDLFQAMSASMDRYKISRNIQSANYIDIPIRELLKEDFNDLGIKWRLQVINRSMRRLRGGDFGIIAGRPDQGKTSFIASEISYMAQQLAEGDNVLWLNNEGPGKRIIPRVWQATLGLTVLEMKALDDANKLEEQFLERMGRFDKVRVQDIHGMNNSQVELIIEKNKPKIIVYDMIDNVHGFGDSARNDLKLESMYQWGREISVKYDAIGFATSQISADGNNMRFPDMSMLKDSKTGKQGACDFQIMIGSVSDPLMRTARFIGIPKNKLRRPDGPSDPQAEVHFDAIRSLYKDIEVDPSTGV